MSFPPTQSGPNPGPPAGQGLVVGPDEGVAYWWLGSLSVNKLDGQTSGGSLDIVDHTVPPGYAPPTHTHRDQDEVFYVLEGDFRVRCGPDEFDAGPGSLVYLPKGVPHGFEMTSDEPGRTLLINVPSGFADVVAEIGEPATEHSLPPHDLPQPDPDEVRRISEMHGIVAADET